MEPHLPAHPPPPTRQAAGVTCDLGPQVGAHVWDVDAAAHNVHPAQRRRRRQRERRAAGAPIGCMGWGAGGRKGGACPSGRCWALGWQHWGHACACLLTTGGAGEETNAFKPGGQSELAGRAALTCGHPLPPQWRVLLCLSPPPHPLRRPLLVLPHRCPQRPFQRWRLLHRCRRGGASGGTGTRTARR